MMDLLRLQRSRQRGRRLPAGTLCVDRSGRHGNPFTIRPDFEASRTGWTVQIRGEVYRFPTKRAAHTFAVDRFPETTRGRETAIMKDLRGHHLACFCELCPRHAVAGKALGAPCPDCMPCHSDVLGRIANGPLRCEPAEVRYG